MIRALTRQVGRPISPRATLGASQIQPLIQTRGKRTQRLAPGAQRVINMLSAFSARKKQPRRLSLCREDLVRHEVVQAAWRLFMRDERAERTRKLRAQHERIVEACDALAEIDPKLFEAANKREDGKRFSLELRTPTETPPRVPWQFDWKPSEPKPN